MIPPRASAECTEWIIAEGTPGRECPHDDFGLRPRMGTIGMSEDGVPIRNIESPYGRGVRSLSGATGNFFRYASGPEFPRAETNRQPAD